jgi:hypothetical protein
MTHSRKYGLNLAIAAALSIAGVNSAYADGSSTGGKWNHMLAPLYLWGMSIDGESQLGPTISPLQIEFKDAISDMEAVFTVHYEAKKDALSLIGEYQFIDLAPSSELPGGQSVDVNFKNQMGELAVAYRLGGSDATDWEILGGLRYTKQKLKASLVGITPIDTDESWTVGIIGGRVITQISDNWSFAGRADWGTGGSDSTQLNLSGLFDWRFKNWGSLFFGYRWMDYDYDNGKSGFDHYAYKATQQGPVGGVAFHW